MANVIQIPDDRKKPFRREDWIGRNLTVPAAFPDDLAEYFDQVLAIPPDIEEQYLPHVNLSVADFLSFPLLHQETTLISIKASEIFSKHTANQPVSCLRDRSIPARQFIDAARAAVHQAILDGSSSVTDPRFKGGRLPLWTITLWYQVQNAREAQGVWETTSTWLETNESVDVAVQGAIDNVKHTLHHLSWNAPVKALQAHAGITTLHFARLLTDRMITTFLVGMMTEWVVEKSKVNTRDSQFEVVALNLASTLLGTASRDAFKSHKSRFLRSMEGVLRKEKTLLFPVYIAEQKHFVVMEIDGMARTYSHGNSLEKDMPLPRDVRRKVEWWLSATVGKFEWKGRTVPSGDQDDWVSCGVCSVNMIAHAVMGEDLWKVENKTRERIRWFDRLVASHLQPSEEHVPSPSSPNVEVEVPHVQHAPSPPSLDLHVQQAPPLSSPNGQASHAQPGIPRGMEQLLSYPHEANISSEDQYSVVNLPHNAGDGVDVPFARSGDTGGTLASRTDPSRASVSSDLPPVTPYHASSSSLVPGDHQREMSAETERWDADLPCPSDTDLSMRDAVSDDYASEPMDQDTNNSGLEPWKSSEMLDKSVAEDLLQQSEDSLDGPEAPVSSPSQAPKKLWPLFTMAKSKVLAVKDKVKKKVEVVTKKRARSTTSLSLSPSSDDDTKRSKVSHTAVHKRPQRPSLPLGLKIKDDGLPDNVGNSRSAIRTRLEKDAMEAGTFLLNVDKFNRFKKTIIDKHDAYASFDSKDPLHVRHSKCGEWIKMRQAYNTVNFSVHVHGIAGRKPCNEAPKSKLTGGNTKTLESVWGPLSTEEPNATTSTAKVQVPCPGLRASKSSKVDTYLKRTYASGGGGPSVTLLTEEYYPNAEGGFLKLTSDQKELLRNVQEHRYKWLNKKGPDRVVSVTCAHFMTVAEGIDENDIPICDDCSSLFKDENFKVAVRVPMPPDKMMKYVPKVHRAADENAIQRFGRVSGLKEIIEANQENAREPCVVFAKWVLAGHFDAENVFVSLVKAMVSKKERELNGLGMEGFRYPPDVMELAHILVIHSPRAYQAIRNVLPVPTDRTLGRQRAREIRFPVGIQERNFELADEHMKKLNYSGPVGLACDDTKLLLGLGSYYDAQRKGWYLLGSTGEPMLIADPEGLAREIRQGLIEKADKLRLWTLQIPLPGVPTIILAAKAIRDNLSAETLIDYSAQLLFGLLNRGMKVVGYAADGAATERKVQRELIELASDVRDYHIPHPARTRETINLQIPLFGPQRQPVAMIQDSNHGRKTYRNNQFSSSRLMILGDYITMYGHTRSIAFEGGPLFMRDVEKVDRQDDGAATRLFSGHTLRWLIDHHPDWLGTIIYLFVFGELIDAYQSRSMSITDRVYLALRALFFMEMWEEFLDKMGYPKAKHFLSHEAVDITRFLIYGLLQLVIIYRDDLGGRYPLLPWLLSTEACEHVFGLCRQIIKDFNMLDFQYMVPKLYVRLREHFFFNHTSDGKARASGYNHTYTDAHGIDLAALSTFPSDTDIENASHAAYEEACGLWEVLGVPRPGNGMAMSRLPRIDSWFCGVAADVLVEPEEDGPYDDGDEVEGAELDELMRTLENECASDSREEAKWNGLAYAAAALTVQNTMTICELPEDDGGRQEEITNIGNALASCLAGVHDPNERANLSEAQLSSMDLDALVTLRLQHQTKYADKGVRGIRQQSKDGGEGEANRLSNGRQVAPLNGESAEAGDIDSSKAPSGVVVLTPNANLCNEYRHALKDRAERGVGTGAERNLRWKTQGSTDPLRGMNTATAPTAGTAANAAEVATGVANKLQTKRTAVINKHKLPVTVAKANLTEGHTLHPAGESDKDGGGYGLVLYQENIWLAKFLAISSKTAGKNARHAWVPESHKITAVSNLGAQVFRPIFGRQFSATAPGFPNIRFALLKSTEFLYSLSSLPRPMGQNLSVVGGDGEVFAALRQCTEKAIIAAVKELNGRQTNRDAQANDEED